MAGRPYFNPTDHGLSEDFKLTNFTKLKGWGCKVPQVRTYIFIPLFELCSVPYLLLLSSIFSLKFIIIYHLWTPPPGRTAQIPGDPETHLPCPDFGQA